MNRKGLLAISIFFMSYCASAQICKYVVNEKDPITDDIIRTVRTRITGPNPYYYFSYIRNGADYKFQVEVGDYGQLDGSIPKGSELIMRAGNGDVIRMEALNEGKPEVIDDYGSKITKYDVTYQMTEADMRSIAESGIVFIRISDMKNTFSDQEIPPAVIEISKFNAECIFK